MAFGDIENKVYRVQSCHINENPYCNRHSPIKRVDISASGDIDFSKGEKFIYFSRSAKHQCMFIYKKVKQIIDEELAFAKTKTQFRTADLPDSISAVLPSYCCDRPHFMYTDLAILKRTRDFFHNYIPPKYVEIVALNYLKSYGEFINDCCINNRERKPNKRVPEISDVRQGKGAYGVGNVWLELMKTSTISSEVSKFSMTDFFDFILEEAYWANNGVYVPGENGESGMFKILGELSFQKFQNPQFFDKNNPNAAVRLIEMIEEYSLFDKHKQDIITHEYFTEKRKCFKQEIRQVREDSKGLVIEDK